MPEKQHKARLSFRHPDPKTGVHTWFEPGDPVNGLSPAEVAALLVGDVNNGPLIEEVTAEKKSPRSSSPSSEEN